MIRRNGRPARGFALGEGDPFTQASSDLADLQGAVAQGDNLAASGDYTGAVGVYQTAAANGVAVLGPEIIAAGGSQERTQHAAGLAASLITILAAIATAADATKARAIVASMLDDYLTAIRDGRTAQAVAPKKHLVWPLITIPLGIAGIIGGIMRIKKHARAARRK